MIEYVLIAKTVQECPEETELKHAAVRTDISLTEWTMFLTGAENGARRKKRTQSREKTMKIDELLIDHNALSLIASAAQDGFTPEQCKESVDYIMGVIDMAQAMKEVLNEQPR